MRRLIPSATLCVALLAAAGGSEASSSPLVTSSIVSSWPAPALVSLYAETLALEDPALLFPFLSELASSPPSTSSSQETLEHLLSITKKPLPPTLHLSLSLREASPAVEAFRVLWEERDAGFDGGDGECGSWVDVADRKACDAEQFWEVLGDGQGKEAGVLRMPNGPETPKLYPFDHTLPPQISDDASLPLVILYAHPLSPSFASLYNLLYTLAQTDRLRFAVRWKPEDRPSEDKRLALSGFGAGMDIKKSDYLAIDDRHLLQSGSAEKRTTSSVKLTAVSPDDIQALPFLTTQHILVSPNPFKTFSALLASFPLVAPGLSKLIDSESLPAALFDAIQSTEHSPLRYGGSGHMFLNGLALPNPETIEPFGLVRAMREERRWLDKLMYESRGLLRARDARAILAYADSQKSAKAGRGMSTGGASAEEVLGERFDASEGKGEKGAVVWWNDLTKDSRYKQWSKSVRDLLRPTYPGQLTLIGHNLHNLVFALDLSIPSSLAVLTSNIRAFVSRGLPIRIGLVPIVPMGKAEGNGLAVSEEVARAFGYLLEVKGRKAAMDFLAELEKATGSHTVTHTLLVDVYRKFQTAVKTRDASAPIESIENVWAMRSRLIERARKWLDRLGLGKAMGSAGHFFLNGVYFPVDADFTANIQSTLQRHVQFLQQEVYLERVNDSTPFDTYFYTLPPVNARRNALIIPDPSFNPLKIVNLHDVFHGKSDGKRWEPVVIEAVASAEEDYVETPALALMVLITDLESAAGKDLIKTALNVLDSRSDVHLALLHNPPSTTTLESAHPYSITSLLYHLLKSSLIHSVLPSELVWWIDSAMSADGPRSQDVGEWGDEDPLTPFVKAGVPADSVGEAKAYWRSGLRAIRKFGLQAGENGLVVNGRVLGPFEADDFSDAETMGMAVDYELQKRTQPALQAFNSTTFNMSALTVPEQTTLITFGSSILGEAALPDPSAGMFGSGLPVRDMGYRELDDPAAMIVTDNEDTAVFEIAAIIDPVSELAQRWAPILETLAATPGVHVRVYFNPSRMMTEVPIKRFYQYSFRPSLSFDNNGMEFEPSVEFAGLPEDVLFTLGLDTQRSWLAFPNATAHDLDNIRLADLSPSARARGIEATFELESIIVEGHARDMPSSQPPRGLQLELRSPSDDGRPIVDTICMANLGYFQLKANPGPWRLAIRSGRSSEVYELESAGGQGWKSGTVDQVGDSLAVTTFEGLTIYPRFRKRPGFETAELLEDESSSSPSSDKRFGFLDRLQSMLPFLAPPAAGHNELVSAKKKADINIFTVASGLLYERMAFIMMVSVMRHTNSTVKFWFIQNFLSPSFKTFIPHMAQEYGFDYELITYKWPHWLRAQKEKQRTIWGYKILFLDVLFPLELDRVIFVDSDQIVRADLKELIDLDLKGAPYGYAPMGNDREETRGFRFWDSGYWKEHLRGRPYHISALYVVDLDRFRQIAAGDRLRQQYQGLSADPNSLANLDQDLPNNMQTTLPIYTLDRNWLWCATWCSDESLKDAKTIDLCNNPLTHEPKLARAKRIIPEWTLYDDEIASLAQRVAASSEGQFGVEGEVNAFSRKADELVQAVEQKVEFVVAGGESRNLEEKGSEDKVRRKNEL